MPLISLEAPLARNYVVLMIVMNNKDVVLMIVMNNKDNCWVNREFSLVFPGRAGNGAHLQHE